MATASACVFCGTRSGFSPEHTAAAYSLGRALARMGVNVIYGAGGTGVMGALADGTLAAGGQITGVIPRALLRREQVRTDLSELYVVETMHERKALMHSKADCFIALPGGLGTLEELIESLTWSQLQFHDKPIIAININMYWDALIKVLDQTSEAGFATEGDAKLIRLVPTAAAAVALVEELLLG